MDARFKSELAQSRRPDAKVRRMKPHAWQKAKLEGRAGFVQIWGIVESDRIGSGVLHGLGEGVDGVDGAVQQLLALPIPRLGFGHNGGNID